MNTRYFFFTLIFTASLLSLQARDRFKNVQLQYQNGQCILDLSNKRLTSLDGLESIPGIEKVTKLVLYKNRFTTIPRTVFSLTSLRDLDLSHNKIKRLDPALQQLCLLTRLDVSYNKLTQLPSFLAQLSELQVLYCDHNAIRSIPDQLSKLPQLRLLLANDNCLEYVPQKFFRLSVLDVGDNELVCTREQLQALQGSCKILRIENNPLSV